MIKALYLFVLHRLTSWRVVTLLFMLHVARGIVKSSENWLREEPTWTYWWVIIFLIFVLSLLLFFAPFKLL